MVISLLDHAVVGKITEIQESYKPDQILIGSESYEILNKSEVSYSISCEDKSKIKLCLGLSLNAKAVCDRCLEDVEVDLHIDFDDEIEVSEENIDTDEIIQNEIMLNWPMKILCSSDCKGLCLKCGRNLNKGQCGCDTFVPDPRMAAIKDIFESER